jgi:cyanophycin synthetase
MPTLQHACHITIRQEREVLRGRTEEEIINLILEGIKPQERCTYEIIPKTEAIKHAINCAEETFITALR